MTIKDIVKNQNAHFEYYLDGELWYKTDGGFLFPIPIEDAKGTAFGKTFKAITLMRWVRKHKEALELL